MITTRPKQRRLAVRIDPDNPDHHIWTNKKRGGLFGVHFTVHYPNGTSERFRCSLKTKCRETAREKRDKLFKALREEFAKV